MIFADMFIAVVAGYVVYRQESIEKSIKEIREELSSVRKSIPKRWSDKLFDRESD